MPGAAIKWRRLILEKGYPMISPAHQGQDGQCAHAQEAQQGGGGGEGRQEKSAKEAWLGFASHCGWGRHWQRCAPSPRGWAWRQRAESKMWPSLLLLVRVTCKWWRCFRDFFQHHSFFRCMFCVLRWFPSAASTASGIVIAAATTV